MPRIQGYEQQYAASGDIPARQAQERDFGGPGLIEAGRGVQSAGKDLGYAQQQLQLAESQRQVTDVHTALQQIRSDYTKKVLEAEAKADPSDTGFGDRFMMGQSGEGDEGSFKWALDTYREQISDPQARAAFDREASNLTTHFTIHLAQSQARMAGVHAKQQAITMVNAAQDTVQTDPSQYESVLQQTLSAIDDPNGIFYRPGLDAGVRETIKRGTIEQLSSSAVRGMIRDSPQHAKHSLMRGEWDQAISGEQKIALMSAADTAIHGQEVEARRAEAEQARQQAALREKTAQRLTAKYFLSLENPGNPEFPPLTATELAAEMNMGRLDDGVGRAILNMMQSDAREPAQKTDMSTYWNLFRRVRAPWGSPDKLTSPEDIYQAAANGRLRPTDARQLEEDFFKAKTEQGMRLLDDRKTFLDSMKSSITHSNLLLGKLDQEGDVNFGKFARMAIQEEARAIKENRDPHELYDDTSKYYLGNRLGKYRKSMQQSMETISQGLKQAPTMMEKGGVPAGKERLPGETPQQYLERMKR